MKRYVIDQTDLKKPKIENPKITTLIFSRHAESLTNTKGLFSTMPPGEPLSRLGNQQAEQLGQDLSDVDVRRIYYSPLIRARETAHIVHEALDSDVNIECDDNLAEIKVGQLEGMASAEALAIMDRAWFEWVVKGNLEARPAPGAESGAEAVKRLSTFLGLAHVESSSPVMIVSHGGLLQLALPALATNIAADYGRVNWLRNCKTVTASWDGETLH